MKLNKKGFMLAEVVVVSVVIATTLVTLYVALNRLISAFDTRNTYYDIDTAYLVAEVNNILVEDGTINTLINNYMPNKIHDISQSVNKYEQTINSLNNIDFTTYFYPYPNTEIEKINSESLIEVKQTYKDYIAYLSDNLIPNNEIADEEKRYTYFIIGQLCYDNNDCRYYTLKVR